MENILVRTWKVIVNNKEIKVATIEQESRTPSICDGCSAPCCKGGLGPILTENEFKTRKYPTKFLPLPDWLKNEGINAEFIATLAMNKNGCRYFNSLTNKCIIYPNCPESCLAYDCRDDPREEVKNFVKLRMREWVEQ